MTVVKRVAGVHSIYKFVRFGSPDRRVKRRLRGILQSYLSELKPLLVASSANHSALRFICRSPVCRLSRQKP